MRSGDIFKLIWGISILAFLFAADPLGFRSPKIKLPEGVHNTLGELPIVEHFDDGNLKGKSGNYFWVPYYGPSHYLDFSEDKNGKFFMHVLFRGSQKVTRNFMKEECLVSGKNDTAVSCMEFYKMKDKERLKKLWKS